MLPFEADLPSTPPTHWHEAPGETPAYSCTHVLKDREVLKYLRIARPERQVPEHRQVTTDRPPAGSDSPTSLVWVTLRRTTPAAGVSCHLP